jgi:hypothetical protein
MKRGGMMFESYLGEKKEESESRLHVSFPFYFAADPQI